MSLNRMSWAVWAYPSTCSNRDGSLCQMGNGVFMTQMQTLSLLNNIGMQMCRHCHHYSIFSNVLLLTWTFVLDPYETQSKPDCSSLLLNDFNLISVASFREADESLGWYQHGPEYLDLGREIIHIFKLLLIPCRPVMENRAHLLRICTLLHFGSILIPLDLLIKKQMMAEAARYFAEEGRR